MTADDDAGAVRPGAFSQLYSVRLKAGKTYSISMESNRFDTYLRLEDAKGANLAENDDGDGGNGTNSLLQFRAPEDGVYRILETSRIQRQTGEYTLTISEQ